MKLKRFTAKKIWALHPCGWSGADDGKNYELAHIKRLMGKRKWVTALGVAQHPDVPDVDKVWIIMRMLELDDRVKYVERIVRPIVRKHCLHCGLVVIERWARAWLRRAEWAHATDAAKIAAAALRTANNFADGAYHAAIAAYYADATACEVFIPAAVRHATDAARYATTAARAAIDARYADATACDVTASADADAAAERARQVQILINMTQEG